MKFLNRYLNSVAVFEKPDDQGDNRSDAQKERDAISVEMSDATKEAPEDNSADSENTDEEEGEEGEEDEDNEDDDEDKEDDDKPETDEEKAARVAKEKEDRRQNRVQKRIDRLTASNKNYESEINKLKKQLEARPLEGVTDDDIDRMADERAAKKLAEKRVEEARVSFETMCSKLEKEATKVDPKFGDKVSNMVEEIGSPIPSTLMSVIADLDNENGGAVLNYLTDNIDEAEELYSLSERKMTQRLIRISDKLKTTESAKPKPKTRSNLPDPITPISESNVRDDTRLNGKESMDDFARKRARQVEERRKARGY
jgi:hypothetical protein